MKPTEILKEEHGGIKIMLAILGRMADRLDAGQDVDAAHLEQALDFIRTFADKCHHGKEEDLLFVEMEKAGIPQQGGPIAVMLAEHTTGRAYVKGMADAVTQYAAGDRAAAPSIVQNARNYIALLQAHIDKEDNILYPLADRSLTEEQQGKLLDSFAEVERQCIGPGKHGEFHRMLERLSEAYLA